MRPCIGCGKVPTCYIAECSTVYCVYCINDILDTVHGMTPKGVDACVAAVREASIARIEVTSSHPEVLEAQRDAEWLASKAMDAAVALLPKEGG